MNIQEDDLTHPAVISLLKDHLEEMEHTSPPESRHALDLSGLKQRNIRFYAVWEGDLIAGCGALKVHNQHLGELKSMKTHRDFLRRGVGSRILAHLIAEARDLGLKELKLETGSMAYFEPARALYRLAGFVECAPFADYRPDPNSTYMSLHL